MILYLDLFSGASGDMLLASLLDLGLPLKDLRSALDALKLEGWSLSAEKTMSRGISGTRLTVKDDEASHPARHLSHVREIIRAAHLPGEVKDRSLAVFERIGRVEAAIHGVSVEKVHFHEIGAVDSLIDIVGFTAGLNLLGVSRVFSSPAPLGSGTVETAHGTLPVPAPATLALLSEANAPVRPHPAQTEILTPTAAGLLAELADFSFPAMKLGRVGYGVGAKELPWANVVRAWLGEAVEGAGAGTEPADAVVQIECNIDDSTGQDLGFAMERLFEAGALDVWFTPIQMKKNRPAVLLSVLARPAEAAALAGIILSETSTLGVRMSPPLSRVTSGRSVREVATPWGTVRVKEKIVDGEVVSSAPEYEDCARIAREKGIPLSRVREEAARAALRKT
jgi:pyridinium-3,5-bisthiocarboxylic acid mononucleotide nickel chelatase